MKALNAALQSRWTRDRRKCEEPREYSNLSEVIRDLRVLTFTSYDVLASRLLTTERTLRSMENLGRPLRPGILERIRLVASEYNLDQIESWAEKLFLELLRRKRLSGRPPLEY